MSSTFLKYRLFVREPMGNKSVRCLPGIGEIRGSRLELKGFDKADTVLGEFLGLKKDRERFTKWLKDVCGASTRDTGLCYECLSDWCDAFM